MDKNLMDEETLKVRVAEEYFGKKKYETLGKIDFAIYEEIGGEKYYHLWAEAKRGNTHSIEESFVQLILTIGKSPYTQSVMPPFLLGAFDAEKIAFIEYSEFLGVFRQNDFNWNVAPSDHTTKEFLQLYGMVENILATKSCVFSYKENDKELREFVKANFVSGKIGINKIQIHKHNFIHIYYEWCEKVKPHIKNVDWEKLNKKGIFSADFFLADLMCLEGKTMFEKLRVLWEYQKYRLTVPFMDEDGLLEELFKFFEVDQEAHDGFWFKYERPPMEEYREYILDRRDLLVPANIRERKGSFYTPKKWVILSQQYLAKMLGDDWQDKYYVWDCCAGTGNLLRGLNGYARIFASTLDYEDVKVMKQTIADKLLPDGNIFQFDFLNDGFDSPKMPKTLKDILSDEKKRRRLLVYINPPYKEAGNRRQLSGKGENNDEVATKNKTYEKYKDVVGNASNELFAQFLMRIYKEINGCCLGEFSTLKLMQAPNFEVMRRVFLAKFCGGFIVPANTFDNVKGKFPIGFKIWNTAVAEKGAEKYVFTEGVLDVFDKDGKNVGQKRVLSTNTTKKISAFCKHRRDELKDYHLGHFAVRGNDFQNQNICFIDNIREKEKVKGGGVHIYIDETVVQKVAIYFAVRHCIPATWINDRDQFLYPNDGWKEDREFQSNCLVYTLFHSQNRVSSEEGVNHWIPFEEKEVRAKGLYDSHFMVEFMKGKVVGKNEDGELFGESVETGHAPSLQGEPVVFSEKARKVMDAGRELWRYYHSVCGENPNASYYDIRKYFQDVDEKSGKMKGQSEDERYEELHDALKVAMRELGKEIEGKVWEYGFLLR